MPHSGSAIDDVLDLYADTLKSIQEAVAEIPEPRLAEQPAGLVNHPAWTLSHLCLAAGLVLQLLGEPGHDPTAEEFQRFGPGSRPEPDRARYDSKAALLARLSQRHARAMVVVKDRHEEYFHQPPPGRFREFAPTIGRIVIYLLAAHESYHLGQLRQWSRVAGTLSK